MQVIHCSHLGLRQRKPKDDNYMFLDQLSYIPDLVQAFSNVENGGLNLVL